MNRDVCGLKILRDNTFSDSDVLRIRDADESHIPWGPYDHTNDMPSKISADNFDETYFQVMIESVFTLCPGGDFPFSNRFHEAIMAGSIPVIESQKDDISWDYALSHHVDYKYFTTEEVVNMDLITSSAYLKSIADANYELYINYQTFIHGDQVPPKEGKRAHTTCASDAHCATSCTTKCTSTPVGW
mmetsp:Transcript_20067/g.42830  ORF Transcript_20067/g.42830 Transcript_20067/m.42830 type:complete len:187 (-) Transcript_20067:38-598(-)